MRSFSVACPGRWAPQARALALACVFSLLASGPALGAPTAPTTRPSPPSVHLIEEEPSAAEAQQQAARAAALHRQVNDQADAVTQARTGLTQAAQQSANALEQYGQAVLVQRQALLEQEHQDDVLRQAQQTINEQRAELGRWARQAYLEGGTMASSPGLYTLLSGGSTDDIDSTVALLTAVGGQKSRNLYALRTAMQVSSRAATASAAAADRATAAAIAAGRLKAERDAALSSQQALVDRLDALLGATQKAASAADQRAALLAQSRAMLGRLRANRLSGPVGDCPGGQVAIYPNGQIPLSALCPVWGAPQQYLRADAAYAFNRLSQAYAGTFGVPICVTDSYRSYEAQVVVFAAKPLLAAVPGTSNHGWATAADLCGGIEAFSSPMHAWLLVNAPLFGWFHPAWAEPSGSKPEAWHWEFGG